ALGYTSIPQIMQAKWIDISKDNPGCVVISNLPPLDVLALAKVPRNVQDQLPARWSSTVKILNASVPLRGNLRPASLPLKGIRKQKLEDILAHIFRYVTPEAKQKWPWSKLQEWKDQNTTTSKTIRHPLEKVPSSEKTEILTLNAPRYYQ